MDIRRFFRYQQLPDGSRLMGRFNEDGEKMVLQAIEKLESEGPKVLSDEELELLVRFSIEAANLAAQHGKTYRLNQQIYDVWYLSKVPDDCICSHPLYHGGPERVRLPNYQCRYHYPCGE